MQPCAGGRTTGRTSCSWISAFPIWTASSIVRRIRREATTPIVILSGRYAEREKVEALERGADDYVTKPFGVDELNARLRVALRRAAGPAADRVGRITAGPLAFDAVRHEVSVGGERHRPHTARVRDPARPPR